MKKIILLLLLGGNIYAQQGFLTPADNLVTEGIPAIPSGIVAEVKNYTESRGASFAAWHPVKHEMLISTRFGNSNQLHYVKMPGGARKQITFFEEPVGGATFEPVKGDYFIYSRDKGGNEFSQLYRFDIATQKSTLLTDGKRSQNGGLVWNHAKNKCAFTSTSRNGKDRDIYLIDPLDTTSRKLVISNDGGGWDVSDWHPDDKNLLIQEGISANESRIYLAELGTGKKTRLLPEKDERCTYMAISFTTDGKGIFLLTNKDSEFNRLAYYDLQTRKITFISSSINWDIEGASLSEDGSKLAFLSNENGLSGVYLMKTSDFTFSPVTVIPKGVAGGLVWHKDSRYLAITLNTYNASSDVFVYDSGNGELLRWTESEMGGINSDALQVPELISWKSFDGKNISGFMYKAPSSFQGKRPVLIVIHGGPEGQSRPNFLARSNYFLNELGITIIYPNVRGSNGYGKTFLDADNGYKREESVKDIGALLEWIALQPGLDKDRIMVSGGSYGGYMSLAVSCMYADKIRCALDNVGISNFNTFMKNTEAYRRDLRRVEYGDERDPKMAEFFEKISPLNQAAKIKKPLLIVQGGNDPRVPYTEAVQMKDKIKENGGTVWFLMAKDEGHGFRKKNNTDYQFYVTISFMKQFLLN